MATSLPLERQFIQRLGHLKPRSQRGITPLHRPLLLLWLLGRVANAEPRLTTWTEARAAFAKLAEAFGNSVDADTAQYPFWVLHASDGLWVIEEAEKLELSSGQRRPTVTQLDDVNPAAGFEPALYDMLRATPKVLANAASLLLVRYFNPVPNGLLEAVGLASLVAGREASALYPPSRSVTYTNRTTLADAHGGQNTGGIGPLEDGLMCVFSDEKGPYADRRIPGTELIEYRGQGLSGDQTLKGGGNAQLATCQQEQRAIRYWHKPYGGEWSFETWTVIVERRLVWGTGQDGLWRKEFAWVLAPVASPFRDEWPDDVQAYLDADSGQTHDDTVGTQPPVASSTGDARERYDKLCSSVEAREGTNRGRSTRTAAARHFRSANARLAVLLRSAGKCENPNCGGQVNDVTEKGDPILEIDHVEELATGGRDHPSIMIALCPNCHAIKTRGKTRKDLQRLLLKEARRRHENFQQCKTI
ncbi:HNH endonuclease signature motif containing protein [Streptosporangium sp. NPDC050855]|uniref:HNH endonuclease signature motif containing protein n=1 Tax=Streptosporangium sp. NPDC050855 TaxID=3366194 RepID=UPI0037B36491